MREAEAAFQKLLALEEPGKVRPFTNPLDPVPPSASLFPFPFPSCRTEPGMVWLVDLGVPTAWRHFCCRRVCMWRGARCAGARVLHRARAVLRL